MLRPHGAGGSHIASKSLLDLDPHTNPWPRFLRSSRSFTIPSRVLAALMFVLAASFALHCWMYGRMHALEAQLIRTSASPSSESAAQAAATAAQTQMRLLMNQITANVAKHSQAASANTQQPVEVTAETVKTAALHAAASHQLQPPPLPLPPPPITLNPSEISRLEEPWRWFESSGEHKDLLAKVQSLREERGRPLVLLDIGLNIGSAPWAIARICPVRSKQTRTQRMTSRSITDRIHVSALVCVCVLHRTALSTVSSRFRSISHSHT